MSSAHSDDGRMKSRNLQRDQEQAFSEHRQFKATRSGLDDGGLSIHAERSAHEVHLGQYPDQQTISELPDAEDDRASSPAGTIYNNHDVMSENIAKTLKFDKGKLAMTYCCRSGSDVEPRQFFRDEHCLESD